MSDVVAVGLVTGGVGIASAWLAARSARFQGKANILAAQQQASVEREKVEAENARLREQVKETERQRRHDLCREVLAAHIELFSVSNEHPLPPAAVNAGIQRLHIAYAAIQLTEDRSVRDTVKLYVDLIADISRESNSGPRNWSLVFRKRKEEVVEAANRMAEAMREATSIAAE